MTVALLPDVEQMLVNFTKAQPEVVALVAPADIVTELPKNKTFPAVRINRYSSVPVLGRPLWLDAALIHVDVWGGPKKLAWEIAETIRAVWAARLPGAHTEGVVSSVDFGELADQADDLAPTDTGAARPRFFFTATVRVHPTKA